MSYIFRYHPITTDRTTWRPESFDADGVALTEDLAEVDGWVYATAADDVDVSAFDAEFDCEIPEMTGELRAAIKASSPRCRLIKERAWSQLRDQFDDEDQKAIDRKIAAAGAEIYTPTDADKALFARYQAANEAAQQWAAGQYAALGL